MILAILLRRDQGKKLLIPQYRKNDITEFVHDCSERGHLGLAFALLLPFVDKKDAAYDFRFSECINAL